jgi:hypothetical protein
VNLVNVQIQLDLLSNFLDRGKAEVGQELTSIEERKLAGDFRTYEDYERAVDYPFARVEIGARAVAYELVALVESELHQLALEPWLASSAHKGPKNVQQLSRVNPEALTKLKMVSDLPFNEVLTLVEDRFGVRLGDVDGWTAICHLRDVVNAFKHRRGFKHPRDINWRSKDCEFPQRYWIGQDEAEKAITNVASFFRNLKDALDRDS